MGKFFVSTNEMPLLLSLETATRAGSIALVRGEALLASRAGDAQISHSTNLLENIKAVLGEAGVNLREIDIFAAATGPGSFTGLRIGLATVKSFAATLARPCIGIQTLHAVAHAAGESRCTIAMLPAGRGEVYAQRLAVYGTGAVQPLSAPTNKAPLSLLDNVSTLRQLKWAGEGAHVFAEEIKARALSEGIAFQTTDSQTLISNDEERWALINSPEVLAVNVATLALSLARAGDITLPRDLQAIYVRPSDAELNQRCQE
jgi:tRNA threonylcarbamoyladenosine biosynthesis protein TsaB